jgi:hypothetical protein
LLQIANKLGFSKKKKPCCFCLCIPLSLLGNGSLNTFALQRRVVGDLVVCVVLVVSGKHAVGFSQLSFPHSIQTDSVVHPTSCSVSTAVLSLEVKRLGPEAHCSQTSLNPVEYFAQLCTEQLHVLPSLTRTKSEVSRS